MNKPVLTQQDVLPADTTEALQKMLKLTQSVKVLAVREAEAIAAQDSDALKIVIAQKWDLSTTYQKGANEFRARLAEFEAADRTAVQALQAEHEALATLTAENSVAYNRMVNVKNQ